MNKLELYRKYRQIYGESAQDGVFSEEAGEYLVAKSKYNRGIGHYEDVIEEIADNLICFEQLVLNIADKNGIENYLLWDIISGFKEHKLKRMEERLSK